MKVTAEYVFFREGAQNGLYNNPKSMRSLNYYGIFAYDVMPT